MLLLSNSACWCAPVASRITPLLVAWRSPNAPRPGQCGNGPWIKTIHRHNRHSVRPWPKFFEGPWPGGTVGSCFWRSKCFLQQNVWKRSCVSILALINLVTRRWQLDKTLGHWVKCKEPAFSGLLWNRQQTAPSQPAFRKKHNGVSKVKDSEVGYGPAHTSRTVSFQILLQSLLRNTN